MGDRTEHTRTVFAWLNQLLSDRDLTGFVVAFVVAQHINHNSGEGYPSAKRIATKTGLSESTVIAAVDRLEARGHLAIERGSQGRGHSNRYRMIIKPRPADVLEPGKPRPADVLQCAKNLGQPEPKTSASRRENLGQPEIKPRPAEVNNLIEQLGGTTEREQGRALCASMCARACEPAKKFNGLAEPDEVEQHKALAEAFAGTDFGEHVAQRAAACAADQGRTYDDWPPDYREQFWDAYPHKVGKRPALVALARLRRRKRDRPTWAELINRLAWYVHDHKYDQKWLNPKTWIEEERWNDRPAH